MLKDFASSPAGMGSALAQSYYMRASNFSPLSVMKSGREDKENYEAYGQAKVWSMVYSSCSNSAQPRWLWLGRSKPPGVAL